MLSSACRPRRGPLLAAAVPAGALLWLSACTSGPDAPPPSPAPSVAAVPPTGSPDVTNDAPALARWWTRLGDPTLDALVARAEGANTSLKAALASVRAAYASAGVAEASLWPQLAGGAQYQRTLTNIAQLAATGVKVEPYDMYAYGIGMGSWEIDLWGSVKRQVEATQADASAQVDSMRDALVSVRSQVAANYVQLRMLETQRALLRSNIDAFTRTRDAIRARFEQGTTSALDLARAETQLDSVEAQLPSVESALRSTQASLAVLCGTTPDEMLAQLAAPAAIPTPPESMGIGLPADLLERRADVRAAWQKAVAATAAVGVAEATRLPRITLGGNFYIASNTVSGLGDLANKAYAFGPSLSVPIFTAGAVDNTIRQQKALAEAALEQYRGAVLSAIADLSASVGDFVLTRESQGRADDAFASATRALALANQQFDAGVTDVTTLLDVQRAVLDAENAAVEARAATAQGYIGLCRALGGGWEESQESKPGEAQASARSEEQKP
ncbi:MAG: efflux transporter outer membrane subunit [Planctomycetota bacterium]